MTKTCTKCGETKELTEFKKTKRLSSGYEARCKTCINELEAERRRKKRLEQQHDKFDEIKGDSEWKDVVGYEGLYKISDAGRLFSFCVNGKGLIKSWIGTHGYYTAKMCKDGEQKNKKIHVMVAEAFLGPRPENYDIDHIDRDRTNNNVENLRYVTRSDNNLNKERTGGYCIQGNRYKVYFKPLNKKRIFRYVGTEEEAIEELERLQEKYC